MTEPVHPPKSDVQARELTCDELAQVTGGQTPHVGGMLVGMGDGSVRMADGSVRFLKSTIDVTVGG